MIWCRKSSLTHADLVSGLLGSLLLELLTLNVSRVDVNPAKLASDGFDRFTLGFMNEEDGENTVSQTNTSEDQEHITAHSSLEGRIDETNDKVEELEEKKVWLASNFKTL